MKKIITLIPILLFSLVLTAQGSSDKQEIKKVIETFFEGFHARDSVMMKSVFIEDPVVQTIGKSRTGQILLVNQELDKVLKGIVSIPRETTFKEVLHDFQIRTDGNMANAWTPYSFFLNNNFSHCGVNNFQLLKKQGEWKIIYLIDTRRKVGCDLIDQN